MWVKLNEAEQSAVLHRRSKRHKVVSLLAFLGLTLLIAGTYSGRETGGPPKVVTVEELLGRLPLAVATSLIVCLGVGFLKPKTVQCVCLNCGKGQTAIATDSCACGGELADLDLVRWVES